MVCFFKLTISHMKIIMHKNICCLGSDEDHCLPALDQQQANECALNTYY
jgi:hypothetical protein